MVLAVKHIVLVNDFRRMDIVVTYMEEGEI